MRTSLCVMYDNMDTIPVYIVNIDIIYVHSICINVYTHTHIYTGFWKTDQIVTLGLYYFIGPAKWLHSYTTV